MYNPAQLIWSDRQVSHFSGTNFASIYFLANIVHCIQSGLDNTALKVTIKTPPTEQSMSQIIQLHM